MNFETYIDQAWTDHANQTEKVAKEFPSAIQFIKTNEQIAQLAALVTHVMGEHLGRWDDGVAILLNLRKNHNYLIDTETEKTIRRSMAILKMASGGIVALNEHTVSDQIRILSSAASALALRDISKARDLLNQALELSKSELGKKDPANRALAVTGNNLAATLEEKKDRSQAETEFMILAANIGRKYWEVAGTWIEVSRAEYRLAMTYVQAQDQAKAFEHAQSCVELCKENQAGDTDMFFCYEVLATVELARNNVLGFEKARDQVISYFAKLSPEDRVWCQPSLKKLTELRT
jgi:phenylpyruvate tautomerase PptA (4-oxalocrotonate tautomerase family)